MEAQKIPTKEEENENTVCGAEALEEGKMTLKLKQFKLNIGGTRYEVSNSLLDQFQNSMLRRITCDTWNNESKDPDLTKKEEIFIERDGGRFKFVLDYMRDGKVSLPLSIPRQQLVSDMEYYGIDFDETQITLGVANPNDTFHKLSEYYYEKERFKKIFESKRDDIEISYRKLAVERISCEIAFDYFEQQFSGKSSFTFEPKEIQRRLGEKERFYYTIEELQPHLNSYGLDGFDIIQGEKVVSSSYYHGGTDRVTYKRDGAPYSIELQVKML
mmetsp:Transcript_69422/g.77649  ORF Transcript_69422/g.77649 Transcript_69422/m.77649 type:complete len:272 (-) Transcript_69422:42-857(-)